MLSAIIFVFLALNLCHYVTVGSNNTFGTDWVVFVDPEGNPHYVNLSVPMIEERFQEFIYPSSLSEQPKFWLYNRNTINDTVELLVPVQNNTRYIVKAPLVILVHGWLNNRDSDYNQLIKNAILTHPKRNDNVVIMDWSSMHSWNYVSSAKQTLYAAEKLKDFVQSLTNLYQINGSKIHLIGHSLGAHVVGLTGAKLKESNLIVSRVTGLDPARPFFEFPSVFRGLTKDAAVFVDVIHTSVGILGITNPAGHADFYPGGGVIQSALCPTSILPGPCEHSSAYIYFEKSLIKDFHARKCHDYFLYTTGFCNKNEMQYMGQPCKPNANGSYYLDVETM